MPHTVNRDNECITVDTAKLSANTGCIVFIVNRLVSGAGWDDYGANDLTIAAPMRVMSMMVILISHTCPVTMVKTSAR